MFFYDFHQPSHRAIPTLTPSYANPGTGSFRLLIARCQGHDSSVSGLQQLGTRVAQGRNKVCPRSIKSLRKPGKQKLKAH